MTRRVPKFDEDLGDKTRGELTDRLDDYRTLLREGSKAGPKRVRILYEIGRLVNYRSKSEGGGSCTG